MRGEVLGAVASFAAFHSDSKRCCQCSAEKVSGLILRTVGIISHSGLAHPKNPFQRCPSKI
jgi:hypothetical protein